MYVMCLKNNENAYENESKLWHIVMDIQSMPRTICSIKEIAQYHSQPVGYYEAEFLNQLEKDGYIRYGKTFGWGV